MTQIAPFLTVLSILAVSRAQAQPAIPLIKADASFPEPFTRVTGLRELPNGKVIVSDFVDKTVQMLDFASGQATKIGREGQGPTEYALPAGLLAMPNGETWVNDLLGRRFLVIDAAGKPVKTVPLPGTGGTGPGGFALGVGGASSDRAGRIYFQAPPFNLASPDGKAPDSLAILRWDATKPSSAVDTAAWMIGPQGSINASGGGQTRSVRVTLGGGKVFAPQEGWGVAADGSIARVQPDPYHVVRYPPNSTKAAAGPPQAYTPIKVTEEDKQAVIEARKRNRPTMISVGRPGGGAGHPGGEANFQLPEPEFETTKPPFTGSNAILVTPEGEVWVARTRPAADKTPSYDVFDQTGKLVRKVTLNQKSTILGFGNGTVYVVRTDDEDLQYLERYRR